MIKGVKLKNWKSHLDSEFTFQPGVNALLGIVGSGKTSVLQAISFGLFGTLNALKARKMSLDDLIMSRPQSKDSAEIQISFSADGKDYSVRRVIKRGKGTTDAEIRENGKLLDVNPRGVSAEVERILQMDYEMFSRAVYSEQNDIDYFLRIPKGKRREHIDRMLRVDRFEQVRESAVGLRNIVEARNAERAGFVREMEKENIEERAESLGKELSMIEGRIKEETTKAAEAAARRNELEKQVRMLEEKERVISEKRLQLERLKSGLKELENVLEKRETVSEDGGTEMPVEKLESRIKEKENALKDAGKKEEDCINTVSELNARLSVLRESIAKLELVEARCPVCESEVTDERKTRIIRERKNEERRIMENFTGLEASVREARAEKKTLEKELRELEMARRELERKQKETERIMEEKKRMEEYRSRIKTTEEEKRKLEAGFSAEHLTELRSGLQDAASRESASLERLSGLEQRAKEKGALLKDVLERVKKMEEHKKVLDTGRKAAESLGTFINVLKATQNQLREEFVSTVNSIMQNVWETLYPYGDFRGIRLAVDGDYVLQLNSGKDWIAVDGTASGGERSIACLALRIAFSHAFIPNLKWLILDEPTHNLDAGSIQNLSSILQESIKAFAEQVFLITHEERISEGLDNIYLLERDKGKNEPTRIAGG